MSDLPWRCVFCGSAITDTVLHSPFSESLDAKLTQLDSRFTTLECPWCKKQGPAVRAATVAEATAHRGPERKPKQQAAIIKGGW